MAVSHIVGAERHSSTTAGAELSLAVGAEVPAAVGKLGLAADPASRGIVLVDGLLPFVLYPNPLYLLLIALELLMKRPGCERQK